MAGGRKRSAPSAAEPGRRAGASTAPIDHDDEDAHAEDDADSDLDELQMSLGKLQESLLSEVNE